MRKWLVRAVLVLAALFAALQAVPYGRDHDNPPVVADAPWPSVEARSLAVAACYDCHSNETEWPWYSHVAPMSWLVQRDVDRGRDRLNFSEWPSDDDDLSDSVEDGEMPPRQYLLNHPEARLSDREKSALVAALRSLEDGGGGDGGRGRNRGRGGGDD